MKIWHSHGDRPDRRHLRWYDHLRSQPPNRWPSRFDCRGCAHVFNDRVDAAVAVFAVVVGMVAAFMFAEFMFTRPPDEAAFLGESVDILEPAVRTKIATICGGFFSFTIWHFASRDS